MDFCKLIKGLAYKTGDFMLASGKKSNEYLDIKNVMHHAFAGSVLAKEIVKRIGDDDVTAVAGVAVGGVALASLVARQLTIDRITYVHSLAVRLEKKDHGTGSQIDGLDNIRGLDNVRVVLVEDVFTTGKSTERAVEALLWHGIRPIRIIAVCDRGDGGLEYLRDLYSGPPSFRVDALTTLAYIRNLHLEE